MSLDAVLLEKKISALNVPRTTVATLAHVSSTQLSDWLRGVRPMPADKFLLIRSVLADVEMIIQKCEPLVLDLRNPSLLRLWIDLWREKNLRIHVDDLRTQSPQREI